jgi:hypothetical protein
MNGETKETNGHAHTWEATLIDREIYGKTNILEGHSHQVSIPIEQCFSEGVKLHTVEVDNHNHEIIISRKLLHSLRLTDDDQDYALGDGRGVGGPRQGIGGADVCVCPECGHTQKHEKGTPCASIKCEKCGSPMRGAKDEPQQFRKESLRDDEEDDTYGPDGGEDDDVKISKKPVDEDGVPVIPKKRKRSFAGGFTDKKWDGSRSRFTLEQLQRAVPASLKAWGKSQGDGKNKGDYRLPYKEPDGTINVNGVRNALSRAKQLKGPPQPAINSAIAELQRVLARAKKAGFSAKKEYKMVVKILETFEDGSPRVEQLQGERVLIRNQKLFKVGTWNGQKITEDDILAMARNFLELQVSFEPPIKAGHDEKTHQQVFGECSAGWVTNVRADLPWLVGDIDVPMDVYKDYLRTKKLRFKSIEMTPNLVRDGKEYGPVLTGLALLGIHNPAVNDLGAITLPFSCKEEDIIRITFDDGGDPDVEETKKFQDTIAKLEKEKDDAIKKFEAERKKAEDATKLAASLAGKMRHKEAKTFADKMKSEGKLLPRDEKLFVQFMLTLHEDTTLKFSQEDGSEKTLTQVDMFREIISGMKPQIDLDSEAEDNDEREPDVPKPGEDDKTDAKLALPNFGEHTARFARIIKEQGLQVYGANLEAKAKKLQAENEGWSYEQALSMVYAMQESEDK